MYGYVYKTIDKENNKVYIGQRKGNFDHTYLGSGLLIQRAINKRGVNCFKLKIMSYAKDKNMLNELERRFIAEYRSLCPSKLYNIAEGGMGGDNGNHSLATRNKHRKIMLKRYEDPSERIRTGLATKLALSNPEIRKKISENTSKALLSPKINKKLRKAMVKVMTSSKLRKQINRKLTGFKRPPMTVEHSINLSNALKGKIAWNKGLTKATDKRVARYGNSKHRNTLLRRNSNECNVVDGS